MPLSHNQEVLFTRQRHEAERMGLHFDYRIVVGDKAYSWATKKGLPEPGTSILLHEQPVHDAAYALSERVVIPTGMYGAGVTTLDWVGKGRINNPEEDPHKFTVHLKDGQRFLLKKLPEKYGPKAWLFKNLTQKAPSTKEKILQKVAGWFGPLDNTDSDPWDDKVFNIEKEIESNSALKKLFQNSKKPRFTFEESEIIVNLKAGKKAGVKYHEVDQKGNRTGRTLSMYDNGFKRIYSDHGIVKEAQDLKEGAHPEALGIDLSKGDETELNKWLIAVTLASRPIQRGVAARAAKQLAQEGISNPDAVQRTGYDGLVKALGRGHYVRYDFSMADSLLAQAEYLKAKHGTLQNMVAGRSPEEIHAEIQNFKGIGPLGGKLFVEGLKPHLDKYKPTPDVKLTPAEERTARLRDILVNSSRKGSFNPYSIGQYNWKDSHDEYDDAGRLIKFHLKDKATGKYAILEHPEVAKYKLDGTRIR